MNIQNKIQTARTFSFTEFIQHVNDLFGNNKVTGTTFTIRRLEATKLNIRRIRRLSNTARIDRSIKYELTNLSVKWKWTLILEGWCGDGAQISPYISIMSHYTPNISLEIILRDENPEIMNQFLTNGNRSIPILICYSESQNRILGHWGPRPTLIHKWNTDYKKNHPSYNPDDFNKELHLKYSKDKGEAINQDMVKCIQEWKQNDKILSKT